MTTEVIVKSVQPFLSTLCETSTRDRPLKRRAMESLKKELIQVKTSSMATDLLTQLVHDFLKCTESDIESVREHTVQVIDKLIQTSQQGEISSEVTNQLLASAFHRLKKETTEEIRVAWMDLCYNLLEKVTDLKINVIESEHVMNIIQTAGEDAFSEVVKRAAKLIIYYAQHQSKSTDYACNRMVRLTMPLLLHKHTAVRVLGIKAMQSVLTATAKGLHLLFEYEATLDRQPVVPALKYDASALVRDTLFSVLGKLLCDWSPRDRYQYGDRILPIILSGTFDELPSVQLTCKTSLNKVGLGCTQDLLQAEIIASIPTDDKEAETMGLKQLVHICFDKSLLFILDECTELLQIRQITGMETLRLFLELGQADDIVKNIKKLINQFILIYAASTEVQVKIQQVIALLTEKISADIYLDVLVSRLDHKLLMTERNGFPGNLTVSAVVAFLLDWIQVSNLQPQQWTRVLDILQKPYLKEYITEPTMVHIEKIKEIAHAKQIK